MVFMHFFIVQCHEKVLAAFQISFCFLFFQISHASVVQIIKYILILDNPINQI